MDERCDGRPGVIVMGTLDTKLAPTVFLAGEVTACGCRALLFDVGTSRRTPAPGPPEVEFVEIAPEGELTEILSLPRGQAVERMCSIAARRTAELVGSGLAAGVVGVGGSGGTTLCAAAMRALPYGVPKLIVSTLASGNTRAHVGTSDIVMVPSITDVAGLHPLLAMVLAGAARAISAMVLARPRYRASGRPVVGMTMYGTTTRGVSRVADLLDERGFEPWIFHASGVGGQTMERLIHEGRIVATADMTLAEVGSHLVGGLHDAGPSRLEAAGERGLPQVVVPGAADTVVLPPRGEVPDRFRGRTLNFHNPTMTTMRTSPAENVAIARFIAEKLNRARGPVCVVLPLGGLSSIDRPGKIFFDPAANAALFETLRVELRPPVRVIQDEHHIDDAEFALRVASEVEAMLLRRAAQPCAAPV